jgi:hypothetical protein
MQERALSRDAGGRARAGQWHASADSDFLVGRIGPPCNERTRDTREQRRSFAPTDHHDVSSCSRFEVIF